MIGTGAGEPGASAGTNAAQTVSYPVAYRGLEVEHDDPFFDRDYNLCILCGRCVRMCQEVRGAAVLAFTERGPRTLVGPAFGRSHVEANCEFCGACVSVCPTGALADKVSKWDGPPEAVVESACPLCGLGCRLELAVAGGALSSARAARTEGGSSSQLCVLGRFCLPETTHHHDRLRRPMVRRGGYFRVADWDDALDEAARRLAGVDAAAVRLLVSGDLTSESLYAAQRFARGALGLAGAESATLAGLPGGAAAWRRLLRLPVALDAIAKADLVITCGIDPRYAFSPVAVEVRRAVRRAATLIAVDARESSLTRMADQWLRARPGDEARALTGMLDRLDAVAVAPKERRGSPAVAVVIGPRVFDTAGVDGLIGRLEGLARRPGFSVLPLAPGANVRGALALGLLPAARVGAGDGADPGAHAGVAPHVLYLAGDVPFTWRPACDVVIVQDLYLPPFDVDVFLPAASFAEAAGTLTDLAGGVGRPGGRRASLEAATAPGKTGRDRTGRSSRSSPLVSAIPVCGSRTSRRSGRRSGRRRPTSRPPGRRLCPRPRFRSTTASRARRFTLVQVHPAFAIAASIWRASSRVLPILSSRRGRMNPDDIARLRVAR